MSTTTTTANIQDPSPPVLSLGERLKLITNNFLFRKILKSLFTAFVVTTLTFFLVRLLPGNPVEQFVNQQMLEYGIPRHEALDQAAALFSFDPNQHVLIQYFYYMVGLLQGDLGNSILSPGTTVMQKIVRFLPWTLFSVGIGLSLSFIIGISLGLVMAYRRESWLDQILTVIASITNSIPNYIIAILIVVWFGVQLKWLPIADMRGSFSPGVKPGFTLEFIIDIFYHASLPIAVYILTSLGGWMLTMKSSTIGVLEEDYVTVARAKGLKDGRITAAYVGRNASLPLFTQLTIAIGFVVGGSLLIESIFRYQGIGTELIVSINRRDYTVMQGMFLVITLSVILANLFADIFYSWIDPRIKLDDQD